MEKTKQPMDHNQTIIGTNQQTQKKVEKSIASNDRKHEFLLSAFHYTLCVGVVEGGGGVRGRKGVDDGAKK
jgi:hypothetical protein